MHTILAFGFHLNSVGRLLFAATHSLYPFQYIYVFFVFGVVAALSVCVYVMRVLYEFMSDATIYSMVDTVNSEGIFHA